MKKEPALEEHQKKSVLKDFSNEEIASAWSLYELSQKELSALDFNVPWFEDFWAESQTARLFNKDFGARVEDVSGIYMGMNGLSDSDCVEAAVRATGELMISGYLYGQWSGRINYFVSSGFDTFGRDRYFMNRHMVKREELALKRLEERHGGTQDKDGFNQLTEALRLVVSMSVYDVVEKNQTLKVRGYQKADAKVWQVLCERWGIIGAMKGLSVKEQEESEPTPQVRL